MSVCICARFQPGVWTTHSHGFFCPAGILSRMTWQTGRSEDRVELNEHDEGHDSSSCCGLAAGSLAKLQETDGLKTGGGAKGSLCQPSRDE